MGTMTAGDDGFITIGKRGLEIDDRVSFYASTARVPVEIAPDLDRDIRADWQWDEKQMLRLCIHERGRYRLRRSGNGATIATGKLYVALGQNLHGQTLPVERRDGLDIYIRLLDWSKQ
jgi:hypothetical protein